jgi:AcrR family transcriptional regulator
MPRINKEYREDAKRKIIAAALDVAATGGWGAVTLEAIAQKVGVTKGAFYSYFVNSGTLMQDVIVEMIGTIRDQVLSGFSDESDVHNALDWFSDFIFLQPKPFIPVFVHAIATMPEDPVFREKVSGLFDENSAIFVAAFARYQEAGQIPEEVDLPSAVRAIYAMTMGLGMMTHVLGKDGTAAKQVWMEAAGRILLLDTKR